MPVTKSIHSTEQKTTFKYSGAPVTEKPNSDSDSTVNRYSKASDKPGVSRQFNGLSGTKLTPSFGLQDAQRQTIAVSNRSEFKSSTNNYTQKPTQGATYTTSISKERKSMPITP
jgi:hypothetical protein